MTALNSGFETALLAGSPKLLMRATDYGMFELTAPKITGINVNKFNNSTGSHLVPSEGVFGWNSLRFTGESDKRFVSLLAGSIAKPDTTTLLLVMSAVRNLPGQPGAAGTYASILSCRANSNGYVIFSYAGGLQIQLYLSTGVISAIIDNAYINSGGSIIHFTFDGRYLIARCDGVIRATADAGAVRTIKYPATLKFAFDFDVDSSGNPLNSAGQYCADFDLAYFGIYGALTDTVIADQVEAYSHPKRLSGTALLDNGSPATSVVVAEWAGTRRADVTPSAGGSWSAVVPPGDYLVTACGPAGYRPISHGPVTAVDP